MIACQSRQQMYYNLIFTCNLSSLIISRLLLQFSILNICWRHPLPVQVNA